jgi:hypothetical protein
MYSGGPLDMYSGGPLDMYSGGPLDMYSGGPLSMYSGGPLGMYSGGPLDMYSGGPLDMYSGGPIVMPLSFLPLIYVKIVFWLPLFIPYPFSIFTSFLFPHFLSHPFPVTDLSSFLSSFLPLFYNKTRLDKYPETFTIKLSHRSKGATIMCGRNKLI